jgi:hypothetical protein
MKYERAHVLSLKSALEVITTQQPNKSVWLVVDRDPSNPTTSAGAYEADE